MQAHENALAGFIHLPEREYLPRRGDRIAGFQGNPLGAPVAKTISVGEL